MGNTASYVTTGKPKVVGGVWVAPKGTTLPTDATAQLPAGYVCLGYVSEDGLSNNNELTVDAIKAWGGNIVYRSLTEMNDEFSLTLIETLNADVLEAVYGTENVSVAGDGSATVNIVAEDPEEKVWVFELTLRGDRARRIVIPDGAVTAREEISYNDSDPIGYGITVSAYPDENGKTHIEYTEGSALSI